MLKPCMHPHVCEYNLVRDLNLKDLELQEHYYQEDCRSRKSAGQAPVTSHGLTAATRAAHFLALDLHLVKA